VLAGSEPMQNIRELGLRFDWISLGHDMGQF
jgi:hypothetical protein